MVIAVLLAICVGAVIYIGFKMFADAKFSAKGSEHTRNVLAQVMEENQTANVNRNLTTEAIEILKADIDNSPLLKTLSVLPGGKSAVVKIVKAGKADNVGGFITLLLIIALIYAFVIIKFKLPLILLLGAFIVPILIGNMILNHAINKRNEAFINMFPDVLDMIVRSVRSGFPLNSAINMVAENMDDPVKSEFRQISDELALGRPLNETLSRLTARIGEQDIKFFVVVLKVQQETGGNLAEIMSNLSGIIRKRKQLRLKIRAMTSEGRITGYILGFIPIGLFGLIFYTSPNHFDPLFNTQTGNILLVVAIGMIIASQVIVRKMVKIDI